MGLYLLSASSQTPTLKPKPNHGWLMPVIHTLPHMPMLLTHMLVYTVLDTTDMLLEDTTWERDLLTPNPKLKQMPNHGWLMVHIHMLQLMLMLLTHTLVYTVLVIMDMPLEHTT